MKNMLTLSLITALLLTLTWVFAAEDISQELNDNIVRLHIIANSDSPQDQALKLSVRDCLLNAAKNAPELLTDAEIIQCCQEEIQKKGFDYTVSVQRGDFYFPQKAYDHLTLPAGYYNAVRIVIGEGAGENWWCVMYPPLCFTGETKGKLDAKALRQLQEAVSPETYAVICESGNITIKPSFKLLELWQELKAHW